ncbi:MAG: ribonuclease H-like domain-containing protein, partial [Planctomycetes bacterium]|nr:ribonuclease H-like domain-containing protein [Planctomycetota bacterium]
MYCYRYLKSRFLEFHASFSVQVAPDPGKFSHHGRWSSYAKKCLESAEHLSLVANISRQQIQKLEAAGIRTVVDLARSKRKAIPRLSQPVFERLRTQARLQLTARTTEQPPYEVCSPPADEPRRGLALLPPASRLDVYFDIEGFPLIDDGLEYLLGAVCIERGKPKFVDWWAHDPAQERKAFQEFVEWAHARWKSDPKMHIYHYAAYEVSAMR